MKKILSLLIILFLYTTAFSQSIDEQWVKKNYTKKEVMIPMRDGVKLFTAIYEPLGKSEEHPFIMIRTPYSCNPYGNEYSGNMWHFCREFSKNGYIIVFQDVRGRWMSEGDYVNIRPYIENKISRKDIDEASDTYDTVDWLLKNIPNNNGNVGVAGCSYPGFYTVMAALSRHPAIKAVCPQAPVTDWFMGDDIHHNGAFMLMDAFGFIPTMSRPRPQPTKQISNNPKFYSGDAYPFYMKVGAISNLTKLLGDSISFWKDLMKHPNYDEWWKARNTMNFCKDIKAAVLVTGGFFDAEDLYGTLGVYKTLVEKSPATESRLIMGPWSHGQWLNDEAIQLGNVRFGNDNTANYFRKVEIEFFNHYLKDKNSLIEQKPVSIFFTGENKWQEYDVWPLQNVQQTPIYLQEKGKLSFLAPVNDNSYTEYVSDPQKPVPYVNQPWEWRGAEFMTDDQSFAARRPDVVTFETEPLTKDITLAGELIADLQISISTTDVDVVVKLVDVFPDDFKYDPEKDNSWDRKSYMMQRYQMLVRGDVMRAHYRNSFEHPEAFVPGKPTEVSFKLNDVAHTFQKGHKLMIQIQSSWFPIVDRNPQQFVDIYHCSDNDFVKTNVKIFHQKDLSSKVILPILNK